MFSTSPTCQRRPLAARLALVSVASLSLIGGSVAVAGPASAAAYDYKKVECNVKAKKVDHKEYGRYSKNKADVKFEFKVWCDKKTDVKFEHWIFQKKNNGKWELIKHRHDKIKDVKYEDKHKDKYTKAEVKDKGRKGDKEHVFHVVKIKFEDKNGRYSHTVTKRDYADGTVDFGRGY